MENNNATSPALSESALPQTIEEITSQYKNRNVFTPASRKNYRQAALDRFNNMEFTPVIYNTEEIKPKYITLEDFKKYYRETWQLYKKTKNINRLFFHEKNIETIENICKWFTGDLSGTLNPNKGLYIWGKHGSGKTDFCITLYNLTRTLALHKYANILKFKAYSYNAIFEGLRSGKLDTTTIKENTNIYLDDFIYQDRNQAVVYGNKDNVPDLIVTRLKELYDAGFLHIITCNYPIDQINPPAPAPPNLKDGSIDRLKEMFNFIYWHGESMRKEENF